MGPLFPDVNASSAGMYAAAPHNLRCYVAFLHRLTSLAEANGFSSEFHVPVSKLFILNFRTIYQH